MTSLWRHGVIMTLRRHEVWRHHDVMTSSWRYDVIMTLWLHYEVFDVIMTLWRHYGIMTSLWRYDVIVTSWCHCEVIKTKWRHFDAIMLRRHGPIYSNISNFDLHHPACLCFCITRLWSSSAEMKTPSKYLYLYSHVWNYRGGGELQGEGVEKIESSKQ